MEHFPIKTCGICRYYSGNLGAFFGHVYTAHSEYVSQLGFLRQFATHGLLPVYGQLCALYTNQLADSLQRCMPKRKVHISVGRRNTPTFKHYERLGYQQVFGYSVKYRNADLFKKVVEGMKEGGCVRTVDPPPVTLIGVCTAACKREY